MKYTRDTFALKYNSGGDAVPENCHSMITYREALLADADAIAALHARSWQQHYRGILRDAYLDREVEEDRRAVWHERFQHPKPTQYVVVADEEGLINGFACIYAQHDPQWGALLDNLHVSPHWQGRGVGRALMQASAQWVRQQEKEEGLYLWVFEKNTAARAFYDSVGGTHQERTIVDNPDGGQGVVFRYVWPDVTSLINE